MLQCKLKEKKNVLSERCNEELKYKNILYGAQQNFANFYVKNKFNFKNSNYRYYNEKLKYALKRRTRGTSLTLIYDEHIIKKRRKLQHIKFSSSKKNRCKLPGLNTPNSSKLTLAMTTSKVLKNLYRRHFHKICEQTNKLLDAKPTKKSLNHNLKRAQIFFYRRLLQRIQTALVLLSEINRYIKRSFQLTYIMFVTLIMLMQVKNTTQSMYGKTRSAASNGTTLQSTENISLLTVYNDTIDNSKYKIFGTSGDAGFLVTRASVSSGHSNAYLDKMDNLERSLAAVLIKVAYGTTSTTKRSIPDNHYVSSLTTAATPLLTTLRYQNKEPQLKHPRNYELDLERDHALPTSAPNADILKSNNNPTYANPNRYHLSDREKHRHLLNSTTLPSFSSILKKVNDRPRTISMLSGDLYPVYSPPVRSFFTPPLPPEYQHPFADKPTLRGTNNEETILSNTASFVQRKPIPPPSLMPGHERIPFRPVDASMSSNVLLLTSDLPLMSTEFIGSTASSTKEGIHSDGKTNTHVSSIERTKGNEDVQYVDDINNKSLQRFGSNKVQIFKEVIPSIRRILSGSNGSKSDIPEIFLKRVMLTSNESNHQEPSSSSIVLTNSTHKSSVNNMSVFDDDTTIDFPSTNIKKSVLIKNTNNLSNNEHIGDNLNTQLNFNNNIHHIASTRAALPAVSNDETISFAPDSAIPISNESNLPSFGTTSYNRNNNSNNININYTNNSASEEVGGSSSTTSTFAAVDSINGTWNIAWNIHVYFSVILFTILGVYSLYKMITYNKLTHLFAQSYFMCINLILITICTMRTFYLCYDAYNIHATFSIFISEILLHLPSTFLTVSFSVLILFLSLKSLSRKNNRYSALIRPLTVIVGCGVHVILCITLHYVESYTFHQHYQQNFAYQQQQRLIRHQQTQIQHQPHFYKQFIPSALNNTSIHDNQQPRSLQFPIMLATKIAAAPPPPRVLSMICQIIYIFVCFSLGFLYLYIYRVLKRVLRNKSQNYIHGYQNLSFSIHTTIATALLYVLLAVLQLFGAISLTSTSRLIISHANTEIDWMHWGFQFSLRLIEISIISLTSWVAGLTITSGSSSPGNGDSNITSMPHGETSLCMNISIRGLRREKLDVPHQQSSHQTHSTVAGFFLPCAYTSSQEHFDTDYPVECNANSNIHTYTMRTGKLIYEDSFALNSIGGNNNGDAVTTIANGVLQNVEYNSNSLSNHNVIECSGQHSCKLHSQYIDYLTDTTDHYENPNFDLRDSSPTLYRQGNNESTAKQKFPKTSTTLTKTTSNSGSYANSGASQQLLLLQCDGSYSEPCPKTYDINKFECSAFESHHPQSTADVWVDTRAQSIFNKHNNSRKKTYNTFRSHDHDSEAVCSDSSKYFAGVGELNSHNSSEYKGETQLNTMTRHNKHRRNASSSSAASSASTCGQRSSVSDVQPRVVLTDTRYHHLQNHNYKMMNPNSKRPWINHNVKTQKSIQQENPVLKERNAAFEQMSFKASQKATTSNVDALTYSDEDDNELMLSVSSDHQL